MNTIERLIEGCSPLPWRLKTGPFKYHVSIETTTGEQVAETTVYNDEHGANAEYLCKMANAGPRLVNALQRLLRADEKPPSQTQAMEAIAAMENARTLLNDLLGDDDDQAKRAYMQRSMRETRKK